MALQLRTDLHFCLAGGRAIFLDFQTDRYSCLTPEADRAFQEFVQGHADPDDLEGLIKTGLLVEADETIFLRPTVIDPACSDLDGFPTARPRGGALLRAIHTRTEAIVLLRTRPLARIQKTVTAWRQRTDFFDWGTVQSPLLDVAQAFSATDLIFSRTDRCLPRSLAFLRAALAVTASPRLVLGVQARPFAAHSWVQLGDRVLSDRLDAIKAFEPILVF